MRRRDDSVERGGRCSRPSRSERSRRWRRTRAAKRTHPVLGGLLTAALVSGSADAHEPLFGLGPHSIGQYAWAVESEFEGEDGEWANSYEIAYGLTPDITITTAVPYLFAAEERGAGFGDVVLRAKYRFVRRDVLGASNALALHGGIKLPTGDPLRSRGTGTRDYFVGLSFGHEGRGNYAFADVRYRVNGLRDGLDRGDVLNVDAAYGIRPWKLEYLQPDTVFLVELIGEWAGRHVAAGRTDPNSGGRTLSIAPGALFSYRNIMLKGGVKLPLIVSLNGFQQRRATEIVFAVELHMPPFK